MDEQTPTPPEGSQVMDGPERTQAQRIAHAAISFEKKRTGHAPHAVTVVLGGDTLVVTLHGALSPAERALAETAAGAAEVQQFHRELFNTAAAAFRQEIKDITGVDVRESKAEIEATTGTVVQVFTTGTVVQVYLLAGGVPTDAWSHNGQVSQPTGHLIH
jgi:uncharacterized protein YbcI